jgi:hypothetical protein
MLEFNSILEFVYNIEVPEIEWRNLVGELNRRIQEPQYYYQIKMAVDLYSVPSWDVYRHIMTLTFRCTSDFLYRYKGEELDPITGETAREKEIRE